MSLESIFANVLDLPGVEGAILFGDQGHVLHNAMPAFMGEEAITEAQRRIFAMYETMDDNFLPCEDYTFNFDGHILLVRKSEDCVLLVLGTDKLNQSSLRMVTNMAIKRIAAWLAEGRVPETIAQVTPPERAAIAPKPVPETVATAETPPPAQQRTARYYRGQVYYDDE